MKLNLPSLFGIVLMFLLAFVFAVGFAPQSKQNSQASVSMSKDVNIAPAYQRFDAIATTRKSLDVQTAQIENKLTNAGFQRREIAYENKRAFRTIDFPLLT